MLAKSIPINWHPDLSIFASEPFLKAVGDEYGWLGGIDPSGELRCILPYTIIRKPMIRMVRFRVETIPLLGELTIEEEKAFLNNTVDYFRSNGVSMIIPATTNTIFRTYPDGAAAAPYGSYIMDLTQDEEILFSLLNSSHRRKVRLAQKHGVKILSGIQYLEMAYHMVWETFKRSALPFMGLEAFKRYIAGLGENVRIFVAELQGVIQGCLVVPFSDFCAYYVYGGSIPEPVTGATNLLHWEAIRYFLSQGVKRYDFVGVRIDPEKGSKAEGLKMFKERFGGRLVQGYMWKMSLAHWKYKVYSLAVRRLRGGDIVDQERRRIN
jgi:lipid II:glycine glycyltransferase (peptidoglycan interpeptide bridge formation enzyme)